MACSIMANQRSSARSRCFLKSVRRIMTVISFGNRLTALYFTAFSSKRNLKIPQIAQIAYAVFMHIILHCFSCHNIHICTQNISRQYISHMHRCIGCDGVEQCHAVEYFLFSQRTICFHRQARQVCPWIRTVEVTVRTGCCNSFLPYSAPLGQLLPVTAKPFSSSTLRWQPLGQVMHISSVMPDPPPRSP